ncbi:MAG TPA: BtrH N-terminal domain-containing protein [Candidatus Limnocylindrales bacterium]|nr:BtrH N-terminal domain-containing protein [Candidatus Limnocylindrales bacterium]
MTRQKALKRLIRQRMAKTGEHYAAARRHFLSTGPRADAVAGEAPQVAVDGYLLRGGLHPDTAAVANVLADLGVTSPVDGQPFSEAMVLGLGGGLGAGYILWEFAAAKGDKPDAAHGDRRLVTLGFRIDWQYPRRWFERIAQRFGAQISFRETGSPRVAESAMDEAFADGRRPIAWVDVADLGLWGHPQSRSGWAGYPVVLIGPAKDGDAVLVDDRGRAAFAVPRQRLAAARGRIGSDKNRLAILAPAASLDAAGLRTAVREGIGQCVAHLAQPSDSFSLPAWRKWARLVTDRRNAKAWPRVFADRAGLFSALLGVVEGVDGGIGAFGGHLRGLYADFLRDAAALLDESRLRVAADRWADAADLWEDLSDAVMPHDLPDGLEALEAAEQLHDAVMAGDAGRAASARAAERLWAMHDRHARSFPLPDDRVEALFGELGSRLEAIHAAELAAQAALREANAGPRLRAPS